MRRLRGHGAYGSYDEAIGDPAIDVVLMLRPTESATIFLQQLELWLSGKTPARLVTER